MFAVVSETSAKKAAVIKIVPVNWIINFDKKSFVKTNSYMCYYCSNLFEQPNFEIANYGLVKNFEQEGIYKVYVLKLCGKCFILFYYLSTFHKDTRFYFRLCS